MFIERLSPHFTGREFVRTSHRQFIAENEQAEPWAWENGRRGCLTVLEPIRTLLSCQIQVLSFFRCWALNQAVGGAPNSLHQYGMACDFWPLGYTSLIVPVGLIRQSQVPYDLLIYEMGGRWAHVQWSPLGREPRRRTLMSFPDAPEPIPWDPCDARIK